LIPLASENRPAKSRQSPVRATPSVIDQQRDPAMLRDHFFRKPCMADSLETSTICVVSLTPRSISERLSVAFRLINIGES